MLKDRLIESFKEIGYDEFKEIELGEILFSKDVFAQCARNICGNFSKYHTCKGSTIKESKEIISKYNHAFLINKIVELKRGKEMMESLKCVADANEALRKAFKDEEVMIMGAGPCTICKTCAITEEKPCRHPDKIQYSMEGSGIDVVRMSINEKMTYNAGRGKIGYFSLILF
ncbi:putative metal-binding protein [Alkalibaculum bacchi]|uniref:Putative metal-binding protein n=1 Tax=Alkalibaculum bacchi TaxID=645887 RepID=A0A366IFY8_9FIRM|nr:DUF2284 domain-containing protein [Alkalibaculum bacchi]RBP68997.1 putative metal-binding protein [Alkalibaculum bacchi]